MDSPLPAPASPLPLNPAQTCWKTLPIPAMAAPAQGPQQSSQTPVHAAPSGRRWFSVIATLPAMSDHDALAQVQAGFFCSDPSIPGIVQGMFSNRKSPAAEGRSRICLGECFIRSDGQKLPFLPAGFLSRSNLGREEGGSLQSHSQGCCTPVYQWLHSPPPQ